jgi:hypothetical protein
MSDISREYADKWLGERRIKAVGPAGRTRNGVDLLTVFFEDGSSEVWSEKALNSEGVLTPQVSDANKLRAARVYPIVKQVLELLLAYNIRLSEVQALAQMITASVQESLNKADTSLWGVKYMDDISFAQIDDVLMNVKPTLADVLPKEPEKTGEIAS